MIVACTHSEKETGELAAALCELVRAGDLLLLAGDLGAGKTAFTKALGAALGVTEPITSPTFTLVNRYEGRHVLYHLDVYRLTTVNEVLDLGLPEMLDEGAVMVIEWGDAIASTVPANYLELNFGFSGSDSNADDERELRIRPVGSSWSARARALASALEPWTVNPTERDAGRGGAIC